MELEVVRISAFFGHSSVLAISFFSHSSVLAILLSIIQVKVTSFSPCSRIAFNQQKCLGQVRLGAFAT